MQVLKDKDLVMDTPARSMTQDAMQKDFEYEMAQKMTRNLLDEGLISVDEYNKISQLNRKNFSPFYGDLMEK